MNAEKIQNPIEKNSISDFLKNEIENIILNMPKGTEQKSYLFETLCVDYGSDLSQKIIDSLPDDIFNTKKEPEFKTFPIRTSEKRNKKKFDEVVKKDPSLKKFFKIGIYSVLAIASLTGALKTVDFKKSKKENGVEKNIEDKKEKEPSIEKTINYNKRFNLEIFNSLPEDGKNAYKYMAEENPTPGKWYQILDKDSAIIYLFDQDNNLITSIPAGLGKDEGDMENTSEELNKGVMTTPAGVCLFSNYTTEEDLSIYGNLQFSLIGKSVLGEIINLGQHQTYPDEIESRTKKLNSQTPEDNKFSDGCINIRPEDFKKYIKPYFEGNYSEFIFILRDKKSRNSGVKFDAKELVQNVIPMITEMANEDMNTFIKSIAETKNSINKLTDEIETLEVEHSMLTKEYAQDKSISKQKKIEALKNKIKNNKNEIGQLRKLLALYNDKVKGVTIKRDQVEKIIMEMD